MSNMSISQPRSSANDGAGKYVKLAFDELVYEHPHWYEQNQSCVELGFWLAFDSGVRQIGENRFEVNHDLTSRRPCIVNCAAKACDCPAYASKTAELGKPYQCCHRIAVYLLTPGNRIAASVRRRVAPLPAQNLRWPGTRAGNQRRRAGIPDCPRRVQSLARCAREESAGALFTRTTPAVRKPVLTR